MSAPAPAPAPVGAPRAVRPLAPHTFPDNTVVNSRYTVVTFLPKNLFEQFRRPLNLYFLLVALLQFIPIIAPVNPLSTLLPLLLAFSLTALKEGYDDLKRHRADYDYNHRRFTVLRNGAWATVDSCDIVVGDVITLERDAEIPCDCVALAAPEGSKGVVYIRTDNMDGEIDLKPRDAVPHTELHVDSPPDVVAAFAERIRIECPTPCPAVDFFDATVRIAGAETETLPLSGTNLLLQSSLLKNTERTIVVVVYTGNETKCGMNKKASPVKWAKIDQAVSRYSMIIFACQITSALLFGLWGYARNAQNDVDEWYLGREGKFDAVNLLIFPARFFLLTSVMIPISFKFIVDMSKYYMALVLEWDLSMWSEERGEGIRVKNSGIVEDLAQVQYILSDKTGTLTQNVMSLKGLSCAGRQFHSLSGVTRTPATDSLVLALALCNTVEACDHPDPSKRYLAVSPDEEALCAGAAALGVELRSRTKDEVVVLVHGEEQRYRVVEVFAFSSERRAMSVLLEPLSGVVSDVGGKYLLLTKGADDKVIAKLDDDVAIGHAAPASPTNSSSPPGALLQESAKPASPQESTPHSAASLLALQRHIASFAESGLRTLVVARRPVTEKEYSEWKAEHDAAATLMENRKDAVQRVQLQLEQGMQLVGASAVEDALQDDVAETIRRFLEANVKVWMLTGDKVETAQQIARSCGLFSTHDTVISIAGDHWRDTLTTYRVPHRLQEVYDANRAATSQNPWMRFRAFLSRRQPLATSSRSDPSSYGSEDKPPLLQRDDHFAGDSAHSFCLGEEGLVMLVQGGPVLDEILDDPALRDRFLSIALVCRAVVCARVAPLQKAAVTTLVREGADATTLSIGDGGNDVAMIQAAHVGVGISGKEGQQASRAADFAVTQFRHLAILMFVHGHMSYRRTCFIVQYSFYKSMLISFIQIMYNLFFGGLSGVSFWNSLFLTVWNGAFTLPQTLFFCMDRCIPRQVLLRRPALYRLAQESYGLNPVTFFGYVIRGAVQSGGVLLLLYWMYSRPVGSGGHPETNDVMYTVGYSTLLLLQIPVVLIDSNSVTPLNALMIVGTPLSYIVSTEVYSLIPPLQYYGVFDQSLRMEHALFAVLAAAALFLPHFAWRALQVWLFPDAADLMRRRELFAALRRRRGCSAFLTWPEDDMRLHDNHRM